ncbi:uncharacterized protein LOC121064425 isoform X2 [Cygnus olor]|uniref:uncharacterized protein LOC121064425 isoform X2 n=1 Tax=Cygnus olor TaxID=8869 RepID=UPI001ADDFE5C|nr:uncharacterized protein LOC121064425 isoform X2 [Cygnus olor]
MRFLPGFVAVPLNLHERLGSCRAPGPHGGFRAGAISFPASKFLFFPRIPQPPPPPRLVCESKPRHICAHLRLRCKPRRVGIIRLGASNQSFWDFFRHFVGQITLRQRLGLSGAMPEGEAACRTPSSVLSPLHQDFMGQQAGLGASSFAQHQGTPRMKPPVSKITLVPPQPTLVLELRQAPQLEQPPKSSQAWKTPRKTPDGACLSQATPPSQPPLPSPGLSCPARGSFTVLIHFGAEQQHAQAENQGAARCTRGAARASPPRNALAVPLARQVPSTAQPIPPCLCDAFRARSFFQMRFSSRWSSPPKLCPTWRPQFPRDSKLSHGLLLFCGIPSKSHRFHYSLGESGEN